LDLALFAIGCTALLVGAETLLRGALEIARRTGASEIAIGLTLVSVGTSLPEMLVNVVASIGGHSQLAIGNVLGSNVANILLILGVSAMFRGLPIRDNTLFSEIPFSLTATALVGFVANAHLFDDGGTMSVSRGDGALLLGFFVLFLIYISRVWGSQHTATAANPSTQAGWTKPVLFIVAGSCGLGIGAEWVVEGALGLSESLGMSESFVGLTIVAGGTSLPELVTCVLATVRGNTDLAVGNVIGSNIFNLLWVLGISALIRPLPFELVSNTDILMVIAASALLLLATASGKRYWIDRAEGGVFVVAYGMYVAFLIHRG
jgi:cation:H+ antiporter